MAILNNPQARARPAARAATCRRVLRGFLIVPVLALLSMTVAANAGQSGIRDPDIRCQPGARGCGRRAQRLLGRCPRWMPACCAHPAWSEHGKLTAEITLDSELDTDAVVEYESMDLTATGGTDYVALDGDGHDCDR